MTDDYCATLCLHWAQSGNIPGAESDRIWSATQFSYTCWCGTAEDASSMVSVDNKMCNTPCGEPSDQSSELCQLGVRYWAV